MSVPIFNGNPHIPSALNVANSHRYTNTYKSNTFIADKQRSVSDNSVLGHLFLTEHPPPPQSETAS